MSDTQNNRNDSDIQDNQDNGDVDSLNNETETEKRKRRISNDELGDIQKLLSMGLDVKEIALRLGRTEKAVREKINATKDLVKSDVKQDLISSLERRHYWKQIERALRDDTEVKYFKEEWASIMQQLMSQMVVHTDEMMVRDLIMQDVITFRITTAMADIHRNKGELERQIQIEFAKDMDDRDLAAIASLREQISSYSAALVQLTREYSDAQNKKDAIFKNLKTTRDQRHKEIRDSGRDIFSLISALDNIEQREQTGRLAELVYMSSDKIRGDWSGWHEFDDGSVDSILLTAESLEKRDMLDSMGDSEPEESDGSEELAKLEKSSKSDITEGV